MVIRLWFPITFNGHNVHTIWAEMLNTKYPMVFIVPDRAKHPYLPKTIRISATNIEWATTLEELNEVEGL